MYSRATFSGIYKLKETLRGVQSPSQRPIVLPIVRGVRRRGPPLCPERSSLYILYPYTIINVASRLRGNFNGHGEACGSHTSTYGGCVLGGYSIHPRIPAHSAHWQFLLRRHPFSLPTLSTLSAMSKTATATLKYTPVEDIPKVLVTTVSA